MTRPRFAHLVARFREMGEPVTTEESDAAFAAAVLRPDEIALWMRMDPRDRRHAVAVTKRFVGACPGAVREEVAGALMHDIGKSQVSMGRVARSVATIVALTPATVALKPWRPLRMPETSSDAPRISSTLPITEPMIEYRATSMSAPP